MDAVLEHPSRMNVKPVGRSDPLFVLPKIQTGMMELPRTNLCYAEAGDGEPLIIVPATISRLENWLPLARFMGQRFRTFFFELPGHGRSTPFDEPFNSKLLAETVEALVDKMGFKRFSLMGFSFGGILAMRSLEHLQHRIDRMILFAPVLSHRALQLNRIQRPIVCNFIRLMHRPAVRQQFVRLVKSRWTAPIMDQFLRKAASVEETIEMEEVFSKINPTSIEVLTSQMNELVRFELPRRPQPFSVPCYFGMSVLDPMLDYRQTRSVVEEQFESVKSVEFFYPWHQPRETPTFEALNADYGPFLNRID